MSNEVYICAAKRTPVGSFQGDLASLSAPQLGGVVIRAILDENQIPPEKVQHLVFGNVLQAGIGQAPARQAAQLGGLTRSTGAITLNKVCGSGLRAVMDARNAILAEEFDLMIAGGMESMSQAPHLLPKSRNGYRMGHVSLEDSMIKDGLWDPYDDQHMGSCAESCAQKYEFSREAQDAFALRSYQRAQKAIEAGAFENEIATVGVPQRKADPIEVKQDQEPFSAPLEKMSRLRPAFDKDGTITAANASKLNDGAAAFLVASGDAAAQLGLKPMVRIVAQASFAQEPKWFTTAPVDAIKLALDKANLKSGDIDAWEINEAFAVVTMAAERELELNAEKVNPRGGAIAIGHPIGASGARILVTLIHHLIQNELRYGCAAICIGGGEAVALVVERVE